MVMQHLSASCPGCSFPIAGQPGASVSCPNCGISGTISGVDIPTPIFWAGLGLVLGFVLAKSKVVAGHIAKI